MEQIELLEHVTGTLEALGIPYAVVGSYASGAWGEARFTQDIDIVVELSAAHGRRIVAAFPEDEYYVSPEAVREAVGGGGQFNVIHPSSGNKVDFIVSTRDAWGKSQLRRRRRVEMRPGLPVYIAAPEDVILSKMGSYREGGSEKHLRDITGVLRVSGAQLDRDYLDRWARQLGLTEVWQAVLRRLGE